MPVSSISQLTDREVQETAMVDLAFYILKEKGEPILYRELMEEIVKLKGFSEEEKAFYIAQLFTEINIDGRFVCVGKSLWGLKSWYPMEQTTDSAVAQNVKDDEGEENEDFFVEEDDDKEKDSLGQETD